MDVPYYYYIPMRNAYLISGFASGGEIYQPVVDWLSENGKGGWFQYAEDKTKLIQPLITNSDEMAKYGNTISSIIAQACTMAWAKRFPQNYVRILINGVDRTVYLDSVGVASLIIYIDFEDDEYMWKEKLYYFPQIPEMRKAKYWVMNLFGGTPPNFDLQPELSAENGKNFKGYAEAAIGDFGYFYFSDNESKPGDKLIVKLKLPYRSFMCLNENNTTETTGTYNVVKLIITRPDTKNAPLDDLAITEEPAMPHETCKAMIKGLREGVVKFDWTYMAEYHQDGGDTEKKWIGKSESLAENETKWDVPFDNDLRGGKIEIQLTAMCSEPSFNIFEEINPYKMLGTNPSKAALSAALGSDKYRAICWKESTFRQFNASYEGTGFPLPCYAHDGGFGLMMPTPATADEIWNWSINVSKGISILDAAINQSKQHLINMNAGLRPIPDPSITMTEEQHLQNAFSLYRIGQYYYTAKLVQGSQYQLIRSNGTGSDYSDSIMEYMNSKPWE